MCINFFHFWPTVLKLLIAKRFAIIVLKPGARQDCAINPSLSSAKQITSSPLFQSQLGMFSKYAYKKKNIFSKKKHT